MDESTSLLANNGSETYDNEMTLRKSYSSNDDSQGKKDKKKKSKPKDDSDDEDDPILSNMTPADEQALLNVARSKYDMKNHMANERTFFKYLFTGLHVGSIGTLVLNFFPGNDFSKIYLVIFIWIIAFAFMFWGLYGYYHRKYLMENGLFRDTQMLNPHMPLIITGVFFFIILMVCAYAVFMGSSANPNLSWGELLSLNPKAKVTGHRPPHTQP